MTQFSFPLSSVVLVTQEKSGKSDGMIFFPFLIYIMERYRDASRRQGVVMRGEVGGDN